MEARGAMNFEPRTTRMGADKGRDTQGYAWQAKLALRFQIPSQASSHGIVKGPSLILLRKWQKGSRTLLWPFRRKAPWKY